MAQPVADPGFANGGGQGRAPQARVSRGVGFEKGVSPFPMGEGSDLPPPQKIFRF